MQIDELTKCKKILENQLSLNMKSKEPSQPIYQKRIAFLIDDLRSLIQLQINPELHNHINKLCNPDEK